MSSTTPALEVLNVSERFGGVHALQDVSLTIPEGEIRGVIGPNGAGKTTLMNVLSGVRQPTDGWIHCFGTDVSGWPAYRMARDAGIVRTFQTVRLFATMSVFDNVLVAADAQTPDRQRSRLTRIRHHRRSARKRTEEVLEQLGLNDIRHRLTTELAYGRRRQVEIDRSMVMRPRIVVLDEPAAGLNGAERAELGRILQQMRHDGITIILVEHQMDLVTTVCDQLSVLDFGQIICEGPPQQVIENPRVLEAYLGAPTNPTPSVN